MSEQMHLIYWTSLTGLLSCLATGLGAIPVHFVKNDSKFLRAFSSSFAAGMMISASVFSLAQEGIALKVKIPGAPYEVIVGLLLGALFSGGPKNLSMPITLKTTIWLKGFQKRRPAFYCPVHPLDPGRDCDWRWVRDWKLSFWFDYGDCDWRAQYSGRHCDFAPA